MNLTETYKNCTINGTMVEGIEVVTWTDTFGTTWKAKFWAHAKREIDKFDQMVERKWKEGRGSREHYVRTRHSICFS